MKKVLISTGGSGGHVLPSLSLYDHLKNNCEVYLTTDKRGSSFIDKKYYNFVLKFVVFVETLNSKSQTVLTKSLKI